MARGAARMTSLPLVKAVVKDFGTADGRSITRDGLKDKLTGTKPAEIKEKCIEILRQAATVIDAKAPGDAAAFKGWLRHISQMLEANGIKLDRPYTKNEQTGAALAFITDPWGTYIELNERPNPTYIN
jgi:hypothetical protein